jgi:hypothetical protein
MYVEMYVCMYVCMYKQRLISHSYFWGHASLVVTAILNLLMIAVYVGPESYTESVLALCFVCITSMYSKRSDLVLNLSFVFMCSPICIFTFHLLSVDSDCGQVCARAAVLVRGADLLFWRHPPHSCPLSRRGPFLDWSQDQGGVCVCVCVCVCVYVCVSVFVR